MTTSLRSIMLPLSRESVLNIRAGEEILLSGTMLVGRDQVHKRFHALLADGEPLPVSIKGETIYYMGPAPAPEGWAIGSCGPTTAARMDPFAPELLDAGLIGMIGKGPRSREVREAILRNEGVYFYAYGGCGALYARKVTRLETAAFADLGPEALFRITVKDFPVIAAIDALGDSIL